MDRNIFARMTWSQTNLTIDLYYGKSDPNTPVSGGFPRDDQTPGFCDADETKPTDHSLASYHRKKPSMGIHSLQIG